MFWLFIFIVAVAFVIEAGKPKNRSPRRDGDTTERIARSTQNQEILGRTGERQEKEEQARKLAVKREDERVSDASREAQRKSLQKILDRARDRKEKEDTRSFTTTRNFSEETHPERAAKKKELQKILDRARDRREGLEGARKPAVIRESKRPDHVFASSARADKSIGADTHRVPEVRSPAVPARHAGKHVDRRSEPVSGEHSPLVKGFKEFGVTSLWHMTHIRNVPSIMQYGLLAHRSPKLQLLKPTDISDPDVQQWRKRVDPHYSRSLHEYVPFYINPRNPMLYRRKDIQREICFIEVAVAALEGEKYLISDGNAASRSSEFYDSYEDLWMLPWEVLDSGFWSGFDDGKRKACSEVLVPDMVQPHFILAVHCYSSAEVRMLAQSGINSVISMDKYFR